MFWAPWLWPIWWSEFSSAKWSCDKDLQISEHCWSFKLCPGIKKNAKSLFLPIIGLSSEIFNGHIIQKKCTSFNSSNSSTSSPHLCKRTWSSYILRRPQKLSKSPKVDLSYGVLVKSTVEISQNFVAFSEYMNFNHLSSVLEVSTTVSSTVTPLRYSECHLEKLGKKRS